MKMSTQEAVPPKKFHGLAYRESWEDGLENLEDYRLGGFHPLHIGDKFKHNRYTIINKLGSGSFATVWLVNDEIENAYRALKILTADETKASQEARMGQKLLDQGDVRLSLTAARYFRARRPQWQTLLHSYSSRWPQFS